VVGCGNKPINTMKNISIPIHSIVDVITNSSTVIYIQTHDKTIEYAKALVNDILKASGSDKSADDVFTFKLVPNECYEEMFVDNRISELKEISNIKIEFNTPEYEEVVKQAEQDYIDALADPKLRPKGWGTDCDGDAQNLMAIPKDNSAETLNFENDLCKIIFLLMLDIID